MVKTYSWDDLGKRNIPEVDAIIHLAGKAHDTKNQSKAQVYFDINTGLTQKIYDYFLGSSAKKLFLQFGESGCRSGGGGYPDRRGCAFAQRTLWREQDQGRGIYSGKNGRLTNQSIYCVPV